MAQKMAVQGLIYKHARLGGELAALKAMEGKLQAIIDDATARLTQTKAELVSVEQKKLALERATYAAFNFDISTNGPRRTWPKSHVASHGEMTRSILRVLVEADGVPMTTGDLARSLNQGLDLQLDEDRMGELQKNIRHRLKALRNRGVVWRVSEQGGTGNFSRWVIADIAE